MSLRLLLVRRRREELAFIALEARVAERMFARLDLDDWFHADDVQALASTTRAAFRNGQPRTSSRRDAIKLTTTETSRRDLRAQR